MDLCLSDSKGCTSNDYLSASVLGFSHELVTWKLRIHSPLPQGKANSLHINIYNDIHMYIIHI